MHNRTLKDHNGRRFWEIPKSILGKISSIFDSGLGIMVLWYSLVHAWQVKHDNALLHIQYNMHLYGCKKWYKGTVLH